MSRKFRVLIKSGHATGINEIAKRLGRSPITLRGWSNGGSGGPRDEVPDKNITALTELFASALPQVDHAGVKRLLLGPGDDLESAINAASRPSLTRFIDLNADKSTGRLYLDDTGLSLVRRARRGNAVAKYRVALGQPFRIEFATNSRANYVLAVQKSPSA